MAFWSEVLPLSGDRDIQREAMGLGHFFFESHTCKCNVWKNMGGNGVQCVYFSNALCFVNNEGVAQFLLNINTVPLKRND